MADPLDKTRIATDFQGFEQLRAQARSDQSAALKQVAGKFEAMFMQMMLKSMRDAGAHQEGGLFDNRQSQFFRDMYDQQLSQDLGSTGQLGMADMIVRQLGGHTNPLNSGKSMQAYFGKANAESMALNKAKGLPLPKEEKPSGLPVNQPRELIQPDGVRRVSPKFTQPAVTAAQEPVETKAVMRTETVTNTDTPPALNSVRDSHVQAVEEQGSVNYWISQSFRGPRSFMPGPARAEAIPYYEEVAANTAPVQRVEPLFEAKPVETEAKSAVMSSVDSVAEVVQPQRDRLPETPEDFIEQHWPRAQKAAARLGVDPEVLVAQAALETGWGKGMSRSISGRPSYNLFNIKADENWGGASVTVNTLEYRDGVPQREQAEFRAYASFEESFLDYARFIEGKPRYAHARQVAADPRSYLAALQQAGYATDPLYADKIMGILQRSEVQEEFQFQRNRGVVAGL